MKSEEAIEILERKKKYSERVIDDFLDYSSGEIKDAEQTIEMCDIAISALKEVQQYREIGTVEECREAVEKLKRAEVALSVILSGNYNDECNFCVHNDNPMANCQCISGDGSWCKHNAKWNGEISDNKNLEGIEVE